MDSSQFHWLFRKEGCSLPPCKTCHHTIKIKLNFLESWAAEGLQIAQSTDGFFFDSTVFGGFGFGFFLGSDISDILGFSL